MTPEMADIMLPQMNAAISTMQRIAREQCNPTEQEKLKLVMEASHTICYDNIMNAKAPEDGMAPGLCTFMMLHRVSDILTDILEEHRNGKEYFGSRSMEYTREEVGLAVQQHVLELQRITLAVSRDKTKTIPITAPHGLPLYTYPARLSLRDPAVVPAGLPAALLDDLEALHEIAYQQIDYIGNDFPALAERESGRSTTRWSRPSAVTGRCCSAKNGTPRNFPWCCSAHQPDMICILSKAVGALLSPMGDSREVLDKFCKVAARQFWDIQELVNDFKVSLETLRLSLGNVDFSNVKFEDKE
jgi:hypothetical protein